MKVSLKKFALSVCFVILALVLIEGTSHFAFRITQGEWFSSSAIKNERRQVIEKFELRDQRIAAELERSPTNDGSWRSEIVHPYIGYVVDFNDRDCPEIGFCDDRIRRYKNEFPEHLFAPKSEHNLIIFLTGGSFAYGVGNSSSKDKWEIGLSEIDAFKNKKVYLYTLALGGIKQPQQLNTISMFLAMGAQFDMLINIDGFNEAVLPVAENVGRQVNPIFPRVWHRRVGRSKVDAKLRRLEGEHAYYQQQQVEFARRHQSGWARNTALANLLWIIGNQKLVSRISNTELEMRNYGQEEKVLISTLEARGPDFKYVDYDDIVLQSVKFWSSSSRSLNAIANSHGIPYFHFLQPNQYLENSKKMSAREREIAIVKKHPYAKPATIGYPMLVREGQNLLSNNVNFTDLTQIFVENDEVLYVDGCCHLNQSGYDYVVDEILGVIAAHFDGTAEQEKLAE